MSQNLQKNAKISEESSDGNETCLGISSQDEFMANPLVSNSQESVEKSLDLEGNNHEHAKNKVPAVSDTNETQVSTTEYSKDEYPVESKTSSSRDSKTEFSNMDKDTISNCRDEANNDTKTNDVPDLYAYRNSGKEVKKAIDDSQISSSSLSANEVRKIITNWVDRYEVAHKLSDIKPDGEKIVVCGSNELKKIVLTKEDVQMQVGKAEEFINRLAEKIADKRAYTEEEMKELQDIRNNLKHLQSLGTVSKLKDKKEDKEMKSLCKEFYSNSKAYINYLLKEVEIVHCLMGDANKKRIADKKEKTTTKFRLLIRKWNTIYSNITLMIRDTRNLLQLSEHDNLSGFNDYIKMLIEVCSNMKQLSKICENARKRQRLTNLNMEFLLHITAMEKQLIPVIEKLVDGGEFFSNIDADLKKIFFRKLTEL